MRLVFVGLAALVACGGDSPPPDIGTSCDARPDPHCDHPIDRIIVPKLRDLGGEPRDASRDEVCRRMALDLLGRLPTAEERAACRGQTFDQMATAFLASGEFTRTQRRAWAELVKYESLIVWSPDIADLDAHVAQVYRGELGYAEFVRRTVLHPAFYGLHPDDSWSANVFAIFLGRPARQDEIDAARPLVKMWGGRAYCGREVWWNHYQSARANGASEAEATDFGNRLCYDGAKVEFGIDPCRCKPGFLDPGCYSEAFGEGILLEPTCIQDPNGRSQIQRLAMRTPTGADDLCPDNATHRPECADRGRGQVQYTFVAYEPLAELPADAMTEVNKIGDALVARPDLWEAAADRELRKLLGWWQATFKHPESDLPEVRALLAEELRAGVPLRDVMKQILTSQLYVQPAAVTGFFVEGTGDTTALPPWAAGPSKLLSGEPWLASAAMVVGESAGTCDFRWGQSSDYAPQWVDPRLVETAPGSLDARLPGFFPFYSVQAIQRLGGCTGDARRAEISNIGLAFSQAAIAREVCATSSRIMPGNWSGDLREAATALVERAWNRVPSSSEVDALAGEMQACLDAGPTNGCGSPQIAARWLCQRLIDSVEFATY